MSNAYDIRLRAQVLSTLTGEELKRRLVVALWEEDGEEPSFILDGATEALEVIEYLETTVEEEEADEQPTL